MKSNLHLLVSGLNLGLVKNYEKVKVDFSTLNVKILKILQIEGFITGFYIDRGLNKIDIFLKYKNKRCAYNKIKGYNLKFSYSVKDLNKYFGYKQFGIMSTDVGLLTIRDCLLYNKGGKVLLLIN